LNPTLCWACDDFDPSSHCPSYFKCSLIEFSAAFSYVLNGFCSLFEVWSLDEYYQPVGGYPHVFGGGFPKMRLGIAYQSFNWFLVVHLTFFYGALCDCLVSLIDVFANGQYPFLYTAFGI
jgi:hypothetical protein